MGNDETTDPTERLANATERIADALEDIALSLKIRGDHDQEIGIAGLVADISERR